MVKNTLMLRTLFSLRYTTAHKEQMVHIKPPHSHHLH